MTLTITLCDRKN